MILEYTTDGLEFHFVTLFSPKKKIHKIFQGSTKKEVKNKITQWLINNKIVDLIIPKYDLNF